jgi:hypothetical protein
VTKPLATAGQMLRNALTNRKPAWCPICGRCVETFTGLPVILDDMRRMVEFAHPACCSKET